MQVSIANCVRQNSCLEVWKSEPGTLPNTKMREHHCKHVRTTVLASTMFVFCLFRTMHMLMVLFVPVLFKFVMMPSQNFFACAMFTKLLLIEK
jgi:hypothetical protein